MSMSGLLSRLPQHTLEINAKYIHGNNPLRLHLNIILDLHMRFRILVLVITLLCLRERESGESR